MSHTCTEVVAHSENRNVSLGKMGVIVRVLVKTHTCVHCGVWRLTSPHIPFMGKIPNTEIAVDREWR